MSCNKEIVVLHSSPNGRACEQHKCCRRDVRVGDLLQLILGVVQLQDSSVERVIKGVFIKDGTETCTVGFVPWHVAASERKRGSLVGKFAQIIVLYDQGKLASKKLKSTWNQGMVSYHLFNDITEQE